MKDKLRRRRLVLALVACGLLILLTLAMLAGLGYRHRVELVNRVAAHIPLPFDISIEDLVLLGPERIRLEGIEVRERGTDRVVLRSEEAAWHFGIGRLHRGHLGSLEIRGALLALTPSDIALLTESRPADPGGDGIAGFGWESIRLTDVGFTYPGDRRTPAVSGALELDGTDLAVSRKHGLTAGRHHLAITNLSIGGAPADGPISARVPAVRIDLASASTERLHLNRVEVEADSISADIGELLERLPKSTRKKNDRGLPAPAILVNETSIRAGRLAVVGPERPGTATIGGGLEIAAGRLEIGGGGGSVDTLEVSLAEADAGSLLPEGLAFSAERLSVEADASWGEKTTVAISHADLLAPKLAVDLARLTLRETPEHEQMPDTGTAGDTGRARLSLRLDDTLVKNARLAMTGNATVTDLAASFDVEADGWRLDGGRLGELPESLQTLRIHDLRTTLAGTGEPASLAGLALRVAPRAFAESGAIRSLEVERIDIDLEGADLLAAIVPDEGAPATTGRPGTPQHPPRPVHADPSRWTFETLRVDGGRLTIPAIRDLGVPRIETDIAIFTPEAGTLPPGTHDVSLRDLSVSAGQDRPPFYRTEEITARIHYREAWKGGGIEALRIGRGTLVVDDELAGLIPEDKETEPGTPERDPEAGEIATGQSLATLLSSLDRVAIADTRVILKDIAPGIRTVIFGLEKKPGEQRIELAQIEITSPYNTLIPVARLNTLFVEFTLAGLLRKDIDKVEIVNPTIFVGEHLFWFIEHYRTYGKPGDGTEADEGWDIGEIHAYNGKLVIAPKGAPIPGLEVPFPFSCRTRLGEGVIEANLTIQNADYAIPDIELLLEDLEGTVEFNLPIKQVDNNLVQVLEAKKLRFRQLEGTNPWVSFTYDQNGIYVRFGAEAYGGYLNGEANVYIDSDYTWDAWTAMSDVEAGPITRVLTPNYFRMRGRSDAKVIASGNIRRLFQAHGTFASPGGGEIDVRALDGLEGRVDSTSPITLRLAEAGVGLLRHFRYDTADGKFEVLDREGELDFLLAGPDGKREFRVMVHDHRPTEQKKEPAS